VVENKRVGVFGNATQEALAGQSVTNGGKKTTEDEAKNSVTSDK
jgi:hypothetical protein